jgi:coenzyme F420-reducing hydrogenase gamma subunit
MKKRIAVFDLTDCEGCEVTLTKLIQKLIDKPDLEIINWRMIQEKNSFDAMDIALVEGTVYHKDELDLLKLIRKKSKYLIAFGACAITGGVQALLTGKERKVAAKKIYHRRYKLQNPDLKPIDAYVKIDFHLPGCPPNIVEVEKILSDILAGRPPQPKTFPVCFECKKNENRCLLKNGKVCLGPVTRGGCNSICVNRGDHCWGCWGLADDPAMKSLIKRLKNMGLSDQDIKKNLEVFWRNYEE